MKSTGKKPATGTKVKAAGKAAAKTGAKSASKKATAVKNSAAKKSVAKKTPVKKPLPKSAVQPKAAPKSASKARKPKQTVPAANDARRHDLLQLVEKSLDADKAENIVHVDLAEKSAIADFMVIATGRNTRQLAAMAQHVAEKLSKAGVKSISIEGLSQGDWVLVDGGDIIVHLFRPEIRTLYGLEKMWGVNLPEPEALQAVG